MPQKPEMINTPSDNHCHRYIIQIMSYPRYHYFVSTSLQISPTLLPANAPAEKDT